MKTENINNNRSKWEVALRRIFKRASTDPIFRKLCLIDPESALKLSSGIKLPKDLIVEFTDNIAQETFTKTKVVLVLPPLMKINFTDNDLIATKNDESMHIAAFENWGSERVNALSDRLSYENWGSEKLTNRYENWGSELVKYENWGSERLTRYENWGSEAIGYENWGSEKLEYENWGSERRKK